jgi:hypothetical protein
MEKELLIGLHLLMEYLFVRYIKNIIVSVEVVIGLTVYAIKIYEVLKNKNTSSKSQKPEESFETLHHIEDSKVIDSHIRQE